MSDVFMCGPNRERAQWVGDAWCQAYVNYYLFGDLALARKFLLQVAQSQREDGAMWGFYPADFPFAGDYIVPIWNMLWVKALRDYYSFSGDMDILKELFGNVLKFYEWLKNCEEDGLLNEMNGWYFFDWSDNLSHTGSRSIYNLFYYGTIKDVEYMAEKLGHLDLAKELGDKAQAMSKAIDKKYWNEDHRAFVDYCKNDKQGSEFSEHAQILSALFGVHPEGCGADLLKRVLSRNDGWIQVNSLFFSGILLLALSKISLQELALKHVRDLWGKYYEEHECANWPETCDFSEGSRCHGWGAWPAAFLMSEILGVKPAFPGFEEIEIAPHPCDLEFAKGSVPTSQGGVNVEWRADKGSFSLKISSPFQANYLVKMPVMKEALKTITLDGKVIPQKSVEYVALEDSFLCIRVKKVKVCQINCAN